ncbi:MAG: sugar-binding protein [Monoglobaceae bacterium]
MEQLGELGTLKYLDIVSGNAYNVTTTPEFIAERFSNIDKIVRKYNNGKSKPIWITETGYPTYADMSEKTAAEYTVPLMVNALSVGVERVFWYNLADYGISETDKEHHFGLMRYPTNSLGAHTAKLSFSALAVLAREITRYKYGENRSCDEFKWHTFVNGDSAKSILWSYEKQSVSVKTDTPLEITDFMGNRKTLYPDGGRVILTLENDPVYIDGVPDEISVTETFNTSCEDTSVKNALNTEIRIDGLQVDECSAVIDGTEYPLTVSNGSVNQSISLPSKNTADKYDIIADIYADGKMIGELKAYVNVAETYSITVVPEITDIAQKEVSLNASLKNEKAEEAAVQEIHWSLGGEENRFAVNEVLKPHETAKYSIKTNVDSYSVKMTMKLNAVVDYQKNNQAEVSRTVEFNPNAKVTVVPGISPEEQLSDAPGINLSDGLFVSLNGGTHSGESDLGGRLWLTWDDDNLYFTAKVKDDRYETPNTGEKIWGNDSIQMALALDADVLGEEFDRLIELQTQKDPNLAASNRSNYYEVTISDTEEGPTIWVHKDVVSGSVSYKMENASAQVERDEKAKTTTYWVSFPWSSLPPMNPNRVSEMLMSILVNDCDNGVRKGYIEWGSGIGQSKNRALFRTFQFVK